MNGKGLISGITFGSVALVAAVANMGCFVRAGVATPRAQVVYSQPQPQQVYVQPAPTTIQVQAQPVLASGVTVIQQSCSPGAPEACNGLDDNCNGAIDEGCGYSTGNVQITLAWNSGADIDLYVTDPNNETIYYGHTASNSGGSLDHDGRGDCVQNTGGNPTVENIFWNGQPPRGNYRVEIHNYSACNRATGATQTTLSIAVGGSVLGSYSYAIYPEQRIQVTSFSL